MAGGVRARRAQGDVAATHGRPIRHRASTRPVVAVWEGRIARGRPARERSRPTLEAEGYPLGRFARLDAARAAR